MKQRVWIGAGVAGLLLAGCVAGPGGGLTASGKPDLSQRLFLRGSFTWWNPLPEYQVKAVGTDIYATTVALTADGQPHEFKFADAGWSPGSNCGYLDQAQDQVVELGKPSRANCASVFENFRFTPAETASYTFTFDNSGETPIVTVEKSN